VFQHGAERLELGPFVVAGAQGQHAGFPQADLGNLFIGVGDACGQKRRFARHRPLGDDTLCLEASHGEIGQPMTVVLLVTTLVISILFGGRCLVGGASLPTFHLIQVLLMI
jgi:hypothetical protein